MSILFCDLVDFTVLSESRDPEGVRELLSRYFELAQEIVARYGGTIEKFIGDAVMAVWGTPVTHEDDAERAVRAGLELVSAVPTLGEGTAAAALQARAAVLTGEAAVTLGAAGQGMVAGDLVNTASRLQSVAPTGTLLVGESTYRAAARAITFEPVGEQMLKGKLLPVGAWRALRIVAERGGVGRSEQLEAPFVGRDTELRLIKDLLHTTGRERRARVVSLVGQGGIGKSRLAWEFLKYIDGLVETIYWHQGRSPAYGEGVTFWALGEMVRRRAGIAETDDERTTRDRIAESVREFVPDERDRSWIEPRLLALVGAGEPPSGGRDELFAAWRTFFERIAARGTVVMVFEDLQWADQGLLEFVDHLAEWSRNQPILILTLARPELVDRRPDWGAGRRNFVALSLEPLPEPEMRALLAGLVPGLPERAVQTILARAEGVPLYAVETVRMLLHDGRLEAVDGAFRPTGDLAHLAVPDSLHGLVAARMDALDASDRPLLQDAAVLGQTFSLDALAAVAGDTPSALEPRLRALSRRELLTLETDPRSPERGQYRFIQGMIREVAYSTLAKRDRRSRHLAAARFYEALGEEELAGVLASHYVAAYRASPEGAEGDALAVQARLALKAAANRAAALGSYRQAVVYLEEALTVTRAPADEAELLERAGAAAYTAGSYEAAERYLAQAVERYRQLGVLTGVARASALIGAARMSAGAVDGAVAVLEAAISEVGGLEADPALVGLMADLARAYMRSEEFARSIEWADRALVAAESLELVPVIAEALITRASALGSIGRFQEAVVVLDGVVRLAEARSLVAVELHARLNLAFTVLSDDPLAAFETSRTGLDRARRLGHTNFVANLAGNLVETAFLVGAWDDAVAPIDELRQLDLEPADRAHITSETLFILGARGEADPGEVAELRGTVEGLDDPQLVNQSRHVLAFLALADGDLDEAYRAGRTAQATYGLEGLMAALRAAIWMGNSERARTALAALEETEVRGRLVDTYRQIGRAAVAALDGKADAKALYRDAAARCRELGLRFVLAMCQLDQFLLMGGDDPDARAAADEARTTFDSLGARPFLARLDAAMASEVRPASVPGTAVVVRS